ncbi:MFS transporter [Hymenobacter sp. 15J16-1T3B]|uniref:MFS transporter n=1 Tax=Hymenobacter sp. 15J16-1T3B TaxID=2886941 RepID=UPI001D109E54|nr:MFS transporter [Hymenobacter sp. 15J16-1T3B]MCC3159450.1 MFS transporter [Hymenobacter sp. 15J16-1T3B]
MEHLSAPPPAFTGYQKFLIAVLALLQFTVILDFMVLSPLGDALMKSLQIAPARFSLVVSAYAFSAGAAGLLTAGFADRFDRKKLLLFFYAGFTLGTLGCGLATSYPLLLAARVVAGLFGGVIGSISLAIIADEFAVHQRGRVMGVVQMAFAASQVLGIPLSLYLANRWDWHAPFLLIVGLALVIGAAVWLRMRPVDGHLRLQTGTNAFAHLWHTVSTPSYQTGFLAIAFLAVGGFLLMPFGSAFLINNVHIPPAQLPLIYLCTGCASLLIMPVIGRLSDRFSKFHLFTAGSVLALITVLIYTHIGPTPLWQVVALNVVMFMGIMSRMVPATALNTSVPEPQDRGAYMSVTASLQQVSGGLAAVGAGLVVTQATSHSPLVHYNWLGYMACVVFVGCMLLVYRVSRLVDRKQAAAGPVPAPAPVAALAE